MGIAARLPAVFLGHGNPMNTLAQNRYTEAWRAFGESIPKPRAVVAISAHWYIQATAVTAMPFPKTIHDFRGFPPELYRVAYPAPGDPELAAALRDLLAPLRVEFDHDSWGLDHDTWSVLSHVFPGADVPVIQLSLDASKPPRYHLGLGRRLASLREQGVLVVGSGDVVHNLRLVDFQRKQPFEWALRFDADVKRHLREGDDQALVDYEDHPDGRLAVPTPDHYLPLLYVAGMRQPGDELTVLVEGIDFGSISMTAYQLG
ncbi:MAG: 4,5-DOPA dioxygenase extradiol [Dehalococcoidia bacterium]|nr:4,5-DOPA dioxygenase extradiol [Dehalococcoidia bacterium]